MSGIDLPPVSSGDVFIFYGLLKQGAKGMPDHIDLEAAGTFEGPCRFRGEMYDLGGYPGVVAGDTLCHGVIWRIEYVSILRALDDFEDVARGHPDASLYWRENWPLLDDRGAETGELAQIYVYCASMKGCPKVDDSNWPLEAGRTRL